MRYVKLAVMVLLAVVLLTVALANRGPVTLRLLPDGLAPVLGFQWVGQAPLFLVILASAAVGLLIGYLFEWIREYRIRARASAQRREIDRLESQLDAERGPMAPSGERDEVLALIDAGARPR